MTAAFIHDHYFVYNQKDDQYYDGSGGVFDHNLWNRYLQIFDKLIVVGREIHTLPNKLVVSSANNVSFELIDSLKSGFDRFLKASVVKDKLRATISKADFAIIRVPSALGYLAQSVCIETGKPYVLEIVGCPWDAYWNYGSMVAKLMAPFEMLKLKAVTKKAKACIYVTKGFLQKRYPTNGDAIGISNVNISETLKEEDALAFYANNNANDSFRIGLIGSFHVKYKGHIEALKALKKIIETGKIPNIKLLLVGTGDYTWIRGYVDQLQISDHVEIVGAVEAGKDGVLPFLESIHLYIHPSKQEGLPRVVIEALSLGRLGLASTVAGTPELLKAKYLHAPGDWNALSHQILNMYENPQDWGHIIHENLETANRYLESILQEKRISFIKAHLKN
jgi:glycosyltransferase involved in cell wall biosynthesis